jgi:pullulanase/glycogen debranching enzyme
VGEYWVLEMHVNGFRFDLAATLAREFRELDRLSAFFEVVNQEALSSLKGLWASSLGVTSVADLFSVVLRCFWAAPVAASGSRIGL